MSKGNFIDSLFDPTQHPGTIQYRNIPLMPELTTGDELPFKSPDNTHKALASAPLTQGVAGAILGKVPLYGYEEKNGKSLVCHFQPNPANDNFLVLARINLDTKKFEITDLTYAGQAFAILGMSAAFMQGIRSFKDKWTELLMFLQESKNLPKTMQFETLGPLADIAFGALVHGQKWPKTQKEIAANYVAWTPELVSADTISSLSVKKLNNYFSDLQSFENLMQIYEDDSTPTSSSRFIGPQVEIIERFIERRKHVALIGPPGTGKTLSVFEALSRLGYLRRGEDFQLFTGHEEVKASDPVGAWQPDGMGGFIWVDGPLVKAMTGNGGKGMPILVEEFTRMPMKAQNSFITALSDGYLVKNEKPDPNGVGEIVVAGEDFVFLADMNADTSADDIEMYGLAFASRVRKVEYEYPNNSLLTRIVRSETKCSPLVAKAVGSVYDFVMKMAQANEVSHPMSPRSAVFWVQDYMDLVDEQDLPMRTAAQMAARHTWLRDVAGTDEPLRKKILDEVEGEFRKIELGGRDAKTGKAKVA